MKQAHQLHSTLATHTHTHECTRNHAHHTHQWQHPYAVLSTLHFFSVYNNLNTIFYKMNVFLELLEIMIGGFSKECNEFPMASQITDISNCDLHN